MKRILCFGDSLTYGSVPYDGGPPDQRYSDDERWTGLLANSLGPDFVILEEGLAGRTIGLDDPRPNRNGRNGSLYFMPCLESHAPLDVIVVWLGTNNTKDMFDQSAEATTAALEHLVRQGLTFFRNRSETTRFLLLSPPKLDVDKAKDYYAHAAPKLEALSKLYKSLAEKLHIDFVDMYNLLAMPSTDDGIHLSLEQNRQISEILRVKLVEMTT